MVVTSSHQTIHLQDPQDVFEKFTKFNIRLNPVKYSFGLKPDKFLGYMMRRKCIETNRKQIHAIEEMPLPETPK